MSDRHWISGSYGAYTYEPLKLRPIIENMVGHVAHELPNFTFDAFVVRGMSGALAAPIAAMLTGHPIAVCRKPGEPSHSASFVGAYPTRDEVSKELRYVWIDDFISTGDTFWEVVQKLNDNDAGRIVGIYLHRESPNIHEQINGLRRYGREDILDCIEFVASPDDLIKRPFERKPTYRRVVTESQAIFDAFNGDGMRKMERLTEASVVWCNSEDNELSRKDAEYLEREYARVTCGTMLKVENDQHATGRIPPAGRVPGEVRF
jgi:adenine/guanine phosphoribosyltransferase-like PRPP-binding protein